MGETIQFEMVRKGLDTIDSALNKLNDGVDYDDLTELDQIVALNPMAYLATMFLMDNEGWSKDLMYSLMSIHKPWEDIKK